MAGSDDVDATAAVASARGAAFTRYLHPALSVAFVGAAVVSLLVSEGSARRELWESLGMLLAANGCATVLGMPVLVAITSRWRRPTLTKPRALEIDAARGDVVLALDAGEVHRIPRSRVVGVAREVVADGRARLSLRLAGRLVADRVTLELPAARAEEIVAFLGPRPVIADLGVRTVWSAAWAFSSSWLFACAIGMAAAGALSSIIPTEPFEPPGATASGAWLLGLGAAAWGLVHAALAALTAPPEVIVGGDGVLARSALRRRFWAFGDLSRVELRGAQLSFVRRDGRATSLWLGTTPSDRVVALARSISARLTEAESARPTESARGTAYRSRDHDEEALAEAIAGPGSSRAARLAAARGLVARGPSGRTKLRVACTSVAEPGLRAELEQLAEEELPHARDVRRRRSS